MEDGLVFLLQLSITKKQHNKIKRFLWIGMNAIWDIACNYSTKI